MGLNSEDGKVDDKVAEVEKKESGVEEKGNGEDKKADEKVKEMTEGKEDKKDNAEGQKEEGEEEKAELKKPEEEKSEEKKPDEKKPDEKESDEKKPEEKEPDEGAKKEMKEKVADKEEKKEGVSGKKRKHGSTAGQKVSSQKRQKTVDEVIPNGTEVAAVTKSSGKIVVALGSVVRYMAQSRKYEILDIGEKEDGVPETKWKISRRYLRTLNEDGAYEFEKGARVTAVYPETTCFYPATVVEPASKQNAYICSLEFDWEEEDEKVKKVEAKYVLPIDAFSGK